MATRSVEDPALGARIIARRPMRYRRGEDPALDRPAGVRAASGLAWLGDRLIVVSDDAAFLGIVDVTTGEVDDVPLPAGPGGARLFDAVRGNKADKHDLEAVYVDDGAAVAVGSGGPLAPRRCVVVWRPGQPPEVIAVPRLYEAVAAAILPDGTSLNLEGAVVVDGRLVLANRGGDVAAGDGGAVSPDALIALDLAGVRALLAAPDRAPVPAGEVTVLDLGGLDGDALRLTELVPAHGGALAVASVAERTASWYDDGEVVGCAIGALDRAGRLRHAPLVAEDGAVARDKVEGLAIVPGRPDRLLAVTDPDDPGRLSDLLELALDGPWWAVTGPS